MSQSSASASAPASSSKYPTDDSAFTQELKRFIPLGKRGIFIVPDTFRGEVRINIREYFAFSNNSEEQQEKKEEDTAAAVRPYLYPSKKGVSLTLQEFETLCGRLETTKKEVKRLQRQLCKKEKVRSILFLDSSLVGGGGGGGGGAGGGIVSLCH